MMREAYQNKTFDLRQLEEENDCICTETLLSSLMMIFTHSEDLYKLAESNKFRR